SAGLETALVAKPPALPDHRTSALLQGSVKALEMLGVWQHCRNQAAPLRLMRIVDDTGRLLRAPEVCFAASEIGLDAFGYNIENRFLMAALEARGQELSALTRIDDQAVAVSLANAQVTVRCRGSAATSARLAIGADGRHSLCRTAVGIDIRSRTYAQTALTFNLRHSRAHHDTSTEFRAERGPFTLVPLPQRRSSLVFVVDPAEVSVLSGLSDAKLAAEIERRSHSILGTIEVERGRGVFPLISATATRFGTRRGALIGEAAHGAAPLGAARPNLRFPDAAPISRARGAARGGRNVAKTIDR